MTVTAKALQPFGTTIFAEMTGLAIAHQAINLSQGFPDFEGPPALVDAAAAALRAGHNQYARSAGVLPLVEQIVRHKKHFYDLDYDPLTEVTVTCGATEGIMSSMLGLLDPGDEVVLLEPYYDSYPVAAALAGATVRYCTLRYPDFALDEDELASCFSDRTKLLVLNTPHNPSGKVFTPAELSTIARLCQQHDVLVLSDEVYEHLTFDGAPHTPIATLPGMRDRTLTLSSAGKTFSFTGWKVGWATGPQAMVAAAQSAHQFVTYAVATPLQHAVAEGLRMCVDGDYVAGFRADYQRRRDTLVEILRGAGFAPAVPQGTYFIIADFSALSDLDDRAFAVELIKTKKVAAIPPSVFYEKDKAAARHLLRFAFCKTDATLDQARAQLRS